MICLIVYPKENGNSRAQDGPLDCLFILVCWWQAKIVFSIKHYHILYENFRMRSTFFMGRVCGWVGRSIAILLGGWVGGLGVIKSVIYFSPSFKYINKKDVLIPKMVTKVVQGVFIKIYAHSNFQNSTKQNRVSFQKMAQKLYRREMRLSRVEKFVKLPKNSNRNNLI